MRKEIEYHHYINREGMVDRGIKIYFNSLEEMQTYIEGLNGEYPKGFFGSTSLLMVNLGTESVPVSEYFASESAKQQEE